MSSTEIMRFKQLFRREIGEALWRSSRSPGAGRAAPLVGRFERAFQRRYGHDVSKEDRDDDGKFAKGGSADAGADAPGSIGQLFDHAIRTKGASKANLSYADVSPTDAAKIKALIGADVRGFRHALDASAVQHAINEHGPGAEYRQGHLPIAREDFQKLPDIVAAPDSIELVEDNKRKDVPRIRYKKRFNGHLFVVEEARRGRKTMSFVTMYKQTSP